MMFTCYLNDFRTVLKGSKCLGYMGMSLVGSRLSICGINTENTICSDCAMPIVVEDLTYADIFMQFDVDYVLSLIRFLEAPVITFTIKVKDEEYTVRITDSDGRCVSFTAGRIKQSQIKRVNLENCVFLPGVGLKVSVIKKGFKAVSKFFGYDTAIRLSYPGDGEKLYLLKVDLPDKVRMVFPCYRFNDGHRDMIYEFNLRYLLCVLSCINRYRDISIEFTDGGLMRIEVMENKNVEQVYYVAPRHLTPPTKKGDE